MKKKKKFKDFKCSICIKWIELFYCKPVNSKLGRTHSPNSSFKLYPRFYTEKKNVFTTNPVITYIGKILVLFGILDAQRKPTLSLPYRVISSRDN